MKDTILEYFFEHNSDKINIRSLAKKLSMNHMTVRKRLEQLRKLGLLQVEKRTLEHLYYLDEKKSLLEKRLYNLKKLSESGIIEYLETIFESPSAIIVFGSYSFGENFTESDIDIAVQTTLKRECDFKQFEKKLKLPIELFTLNENTPENLKKSIYNGVVLKGRIQ